MNPTSLVVLALLACGGSAPDPIAPGAAVPSAAPAQPASPHAAADVEPGSHADWCGEHGVLEAVCPKCTPRLAAVFQAKGDWCAEHGFPESFCPICNPEAGGRPALAPTGGAGGPADGTVVRFRTRAAAEQAGLAVALAEATDWVSGIEAVAHLTWDATRVAAVSARSPGVVVGIRAEVGDPVAAGAVLAEVRSAHTAGDRSRLVARQHARDVAAAEVARKRELREGGVASERDLLAAEQALAAAEAEVASVQAELDLVGAGAGDLTRIRSPLAGVVTARHARVGQTVGPLQPAFEVVDASRMWAAVDVPERQLAEVAVGDPVSLRLDALPEHHFEGTIATLSPMVDPATRTATARVELDNARGLLRANLYGTATIHSEGSEAAVVVPAAAVQRAGDAAQLDHRLALLTVEQARSAWMAAAVEAGARRQALSTATGVLVDALALPADPLAGSPPPGPSAPGGSVRSDVAAAQAEVEAASAALRRARAGTLPPVSVGVFVEEEDHQLRAGPSLSLTLPLWRANADGRARAGGDLAAARARADAATRRAGAEQDTARRTLAALDAALLDQPADVPEQARAALNSVELGYDRGELDLLSVSLLQARIIDGHLAWIEGRRLVARARIQRVLAAEGEGLWGPEDR